MKLKTHFSPIWALVLFTMACILPSSCNKETDGYVGSPTTKNSYSLPSNENNPWDSIGVIHNMLLDKCRKQMMTLCPNSDFWNIQFADSVADVVLAQHGYLTDMLDGGFVDSLFADSIAYYLSFAEKNGASNVVIAILMNIFTGVEGLIESDNTYLYIKKWIDQQELNVVNNNFTSYTDKCLILSSTSVLRHSLYYWMVFPGLVDNPSVMAKEDTPPQTNNFVNFWKVALADAGGAISGALSGSAASNPIGTIIGDTITSTVVTIALGAIAGAVKASTDKSVEINKNNQSH